MPEDFAVLAPPLAVVLHDLAGVIDLEDAVFIKDELAVGGVAQLSILRVSGFRFQIDLIGAVLVTGFRGRVRHHGIAGGGIAAFGVEVIPVAVIQLSPAGLEGFALHVVLQTVLIAVPAVGGPLGIEHGISGDGNRSILGIGSTAAVSFGIPAHEVMVGIGEAVGGKVGFHTVNQGHVRHLALAAVGVEAQHIAVLFRGIVRGVGGVGCGGHNLGGPAGEGVGVLSRGFLGGVLTGIDGSHAVGNLSALKHRAILVHEGNGIGSGLNVDAFVMPVAVAVIIRAEIDGFALASMGDIYFIVIIHAVRVPCEIAVIQINNLELFAICQIGNQSPLLCGRAGVPGEAHLGRQLVQIPVVADAIQIVSVLQAAFIDCRILRVTGNSLQGGSPFLEGVDIAVVQVLDGRLMAGYRAIRNGGGVDHAAVVVFPGNGVGIDYRVVGGCIGGVTADRGKLGGPACEGVGVLSSCCLGGGFTGVDRGHAVGQLQGLQLSAVLIDKADVVQNVGFGKGGVVSRVGCGGNDLRRPAGEAVAVILVRVSGRLRAGVFRSYAIFNGTALQDRAVPVLEDNIELPDLPLCIEGEVLHGVSHDRIFILELNLPVWHCSPADEVKALPGKGVLGQRSADVPNDSQRLHAPLAAVGVEEDLEGVLFPDRVKIGVLVESKGRTVPQIRSDGVGTEGPAHEHITLTGEGVGPQRNVVRAQRDVLGHSLVGLIIGVEGQNVMILLPEGIEVQIVLAGDGLTVREQLFAVGALRPANEVVVLPDEGVRIQRRGNVIGNYLRLHAALAAVGVEGNNVGAGQLFPDGVHGDILALKFIRGIDGVALVAPHVLHQAIGILGPAHKFEAGAGKAVFGKLHAVGHFFFRKQHGLHFAAASIGVKADGIAVEGLQPLVLGSAVGILVAVLGLRCLHIAGVAVLQPGGIHGNVHHSGDVAALRGHMGFRQGSGAVGKYDLAGLAEGNDGPAVFGGVEAAVDYDGAVDIHLGVCEIGVGADRGGAVGGRIPNGNEVHVVVAVMSGHIALADVIVPVKDIDLGGAVQGDRGALLNIQHRAGQHGDILMDLHVRPGGAVDGDIVVDGQSKVGGVNALGQHDFHLRHLQLDAGEGGVAVQGDLQPVGGGMVFLGHRAVGDLEHTACTDEGDARAHGGGAGVDGGAGDFSRSGVQRQRHLDVLHVVHGHGEHVGAGKAKGRVAAAPVPELEALIDLGAGLGMDGAAAGDKAVGIEGAAVFHVDAVAALHDDAAVGSGGGAVVGLLARTDGGDLAAEAQSAAIFNGDVDAGGHGQSPICAGGHVGAGGCDHQHSFGINGRLLGVQGSGVVEGHQQGHPVGDRDGFRQGVVLQQGDLGTAHGGREAGSVCELDEGNVAVFHLHAVDLFPRS